MIYQTVTEQEFIRAFDDVNRSENFSREARRALFEYLDDMSDDIGEDIELDPIAICCEWGEFTMAELVREFGRFLDPADLEDDEDYEDALIEFMRDNGYLLEVEHIEADSTYLFSE